MKSAPWKHILALTAIVCSAQCFAQLDENFAAQPSSPAANTPTVGRKSLPERAPDVQREFRGVWIATTSNIDWPSKPGLPVETQKAELIAQLDKAKSLNLNAIIFQVRPACDAMYPSDLEPWSRFLTGEMGKAPNPFYDPLEFVIKETHARGMELHAWFNPYRALHYPKQNADKVSNNHISKTQPEIVREYDKYLWLDPSTTATRAHTMNVILDVVKRYDIDGVHLDDYFYPYPVRDTDNKLIPFPDAKNYKAYKQQGGTMKIDDWRRDNVNQFIKDFYTKTKETKKHVKVGIAPAGIWRPGYPAQIRGNDQYATIYADPRLWVHEGWGDYFMPQIYRNISKPEQSFPVILKWWCDESAQTSKRPIWPGQFTSKIGNIKQRGSMFFDPDEISNQIKWMRLQPGSGGTAHFSMTAFMNDYDGINEKLTTPSEAVYSEAALIPEMPWLDDVQPAAPTKLSVGKKTDNTIREIKWKTETPGDVARWLVQYRTQQGWKTQIMNSTADSVQFTDKPGVDRVEVRAVDQMNNLSHPLNIR